MGRKKVSLSDTYNDFVKKTILSRIDKSASLTGGCRPLGDELGVSVATLHAILTDKQPCSEKTARYMIKAGWFSYTDVGMSASGSTTKPPTPTTPTPKAASPKYTPAAPSAKPSSTDSYSKGKKDGFNDGYAKGNTDGYGKGYST